MMYHGGRKIYEGLYWNTNGYSGAIVAAVTSEIDWAAYIGGAPADIPEMEALKFVADYGDKMSQVDAEHYFPRIAESGLRYRP